MGPRTDGHGWQAPRACAHSEGEGSLLSWREVRHPIQTLGESGSWPDLKGLPSLAQAMVDQGKLEESVEEMEALIEKSNRDRLY